MITHVTILGMTCAALLVYYIVPMSVSVCSYTTCLAFHFALYES